MDQIVTPDLAALLTDDTAPGRRAAEAILATEVALAAAVRAFRHRDAAARA